MLVYDVTVHFIRAVCTLLAVLGLQILPYLLNQALLAKSTNQNTGEYRLHFVDVEISAFLSLLTPGVLFQTHTVSQ